MEDHRVMGDDQLAAAAGGFLHHRGGDVQRGGDAGHRAAGIHQQPHIVPAAGQFHRRQPPEFLRAISEYGHGHLPASISLSRASTPAASGPSGRPLRYFFSLPICWAAVLVGTGLAFHPAAQAKQAVGFGRGAGIGGHSSPHTQRPAARHSRSACRANPRRTSPRRSTLCLVRAPAPGCTPGPAPRGRRPGSPESSWAPMAGDDDVLHLAPAAVPTAPPPAGTDPVAPGGAGGPGLCQRAFPQIAGKNQRAATAARQPCTQFAVVAPDVRRRSARPHKVGRRLQAGIQMRQVTAWQSSH